MLIPKSRICLLDWTCKGLMRLLLNVAALSFAGQITSTSVVHGWDETDSKQIREDVRELIRFIGVNDPEALADANAVLNRVPKDSELRIVGDLATSIIHIRQGRYSDAWKLLPRAVGEPSTTGDAVGICASTLRLWLLLEADSREAEPLFKQLVIAALDEQNTVVERLSLCRFLGAVTGMQLAAKDSACISEKTLGQAIAAFEKLKVGSLKTQFLSCQETCQRWGEELSQCVTTRGEAGDSEYLGLVERRKKEFEDASEELAVLNKDVDQVVAAEKQIKNLKLHVARLRTAFESEGPGKPSAPKSETKTETYYETKLVNGERRREEKERKVTIPPTPEQRRKYEREMQEWREQEAVRREKLSVQIDQAIGQVATTIQAKSNMRLGGDIRQLTRLKRDMMDASASKEQSYEVATIALALQMSSTENIVSPFRPSNFRLLDYDSEQSRLTRSLRNRKD